MAVLKTAPAPRPAPADVSDLHLGRGAVVRLRTRARGGPDHRVQRLDAAARRDGAGDEAQIRLTCRSLEYFMKLYTFFRSSPSFRVRIPLNHKGLRYEHPAVRLPKAHPLAPGYTSLNPHSPL